MAACLAQKVNSQSGQLLEIKLMSDQILISLAAGVQIPVSFESRAGFGPTDSNEHPNLHSKHGEGKAKECSWDGRPSPQPGAA